MAFNITNKIPVIYVLCFILSGISAYSQEEESESFTTGADFCSSFIWRGTKVGTGPAIQPVLEFSAGSFTAGAWGSFDFRGYQEVDLYMNILLPSGFSFGITDYYSPDLKYFDYSKESGSHAFEFAVGFSKNNFSLEATYVLNEAGGIGSVGNDLYFQAGYSFDMFTLFAGAGNGWLTYDQDTDLSKFKICNTGIEVTRTIKITDVFEIPVKGQLVFNPANERMYLVIGITL